MAGRKYGIKKLNNVVKSAQIKSVFIFFIFFLFSSYEADLFLWFLFLTVSSRIRVWGGGEWACETQRRRR